MPDLETGRTILYSKKNNERAPIQKVEVERSNTSSPCMAEPIIRDTIRSGKERQDALTLLSVFVFVWGGLVGCDHLRAETRMDFHTDTHRRRHGRNNILLNRYP